MHQVTPDKLHILSSELVPKNPYRYEEASGGLADFTIICKPSTGYDAVHVYMVFPLKQPGGLGSYGYDRNYYEPQCVRSPSSG